MPGLRPQSSVLCPPSSVLRGLRICFIAGTLGRGGAERQLYYILKTLSACQAEPLVICLTSGEAWEEPIKELGVSVVSIDRSCSRARRAFKIALLARRFRPQIIQAQHFYANPYAALAGRLLRVRSVGAVRSSGAAELAANGPLLRHMASRWPDRLLCNSEAARQHLAAAGVVGNKLAVLPNVVDTSFFPAVQHSRHEPTRILGIGRLTEEKRFDRFLRIISQVAASGLAVSAHIVGNGPLRCDLEKQAGTLGLREHVTFHGEQPDAAPYYSNADVFLLTSDYEGSPNVVMEAAASGLPVVASRVGDVERLVDHGLSGFLFQPQDETTAAESLTQLARDVELRRRMGTEARKKMESERSLTTLAPLLEQIYEPLLRNSRPNHTIHKRLLASS
jgi:glycosyltransferase involved in cell wall biosynthesis